MAKTKGGGAGLIDEDFVAAVQEQTRATESAETSDKQKQAPIRCLQQHLSFFDVSGILADLVERPEH
jgi:hypothetical protein